MPHRTFLFRELLPRLLHDFRVHVRALLVYEVLFRVIDFALLGPLLAFIYGIIYATSGHVSLSNAQILGFFLSPAGLVFVLIAGTLTFTGVLMEQAGLILIAAGAQRGERIPPLKALWELLRQVPTLLSVGLAALGYLMLAALPFLALGSLVYMTFLAEHDINFYLATQPPEFVKAMLLGGLLLLGMVGVVGAFYIRWALALPVCLFEGLKFRAALKRSTYLSRDSFWRIASMLLGWGLFILVTSSAFFAATTYLGELTLTPLADNLKTFGRAAAVFVTVYLTLSVLFSSLKNIGEAFLRTYLYLHVLAHKNLPLPHALQATATPPEDLTRHQRRRFRAFAVASMLAVFLFSIGVVKGFYLTDAVKVTAHRGSSLKAPENSLSAIRQAIADGADYAEIDVQETADGAIVLFHDNDLMRIAGVNKKIWEVTKAALDTLDAGSWFAPAFADERIPTLEEAIAVAQGRIKLNIELKYNGHDQQLARRVVRIIRDHNFEEACVISSLEMDGLMEVRALAPDLEIGYIISVALGNITRYPVNFLSLQSNLVTTDLVRRAHQRDIDVHVWTINEPRQMDIMIDRGINNIITDRPAVLVSLLADRDALDEVDRVVLKLRNWIRD